MSIKSICILTISVFAFSNLSFAKSDKVTFNGKRYDIFLQMQEMRASVRITCSNSQIARAYVNKIYGNEDIKFGTHDSSNYLIKNEFEVYKELSNGEEFTFGTLSTPINLENEELVSDIDRHQCYNSSYHEFITDMSGKLTIAPLRGIYYYFAAKNFRCKYDMNGRGIFTGHGKVQEMFLFITDIEKKIINQEKFTLDPNNTKCVNLESLIGGSIQVVGGAIQTIIALPVILWLMIVWGGC